MLDRSFVMLPGVGLQTEINLWRQGIGDWDSLLQSDRIKGISRSRLRSLKSDASTIRELRRGGKLRELSELLPRSEHWRLLQHWDERFAAIDIEVSRCGRQLKPVLASVIRGGEECRTLVGGDDLGWRNIGDVLRGVDFIVTFNGSSFDIPVLEGNGFPVGGKVQIDLRRFAVRAALPGGLKRIEPALGIARPRDMEFSTSEQISHLWKLWQERGNKNALDLLTRYNRQDAETLIVLAESIYERLSRRALGTPRKYPVIRRNCIIQDA